MHAGPAAGPEAAVHAGPAVYAELGGAAELADAAVHAAAYRDHCWSLKLCLASLHAAVDVLSVGQLLQHSGFQFADPASAHAPAQEHAAHAKHCPAAAAAQLSSVFAEAEAGVCECQSDLLTLAQVADDPLQRSLEVKQTAWESQQAAVADMAAC